ncbi:MFS transporter [Kitasatospora sp. NPDC057223]|uniref:MFS transporter n=1 Tax=Kitasatospora sp. NPDC057223 TaxID=3346055 RepID=UPI0036430538
MADTPAATRAVKEPPPARPPARTPTTRTRTPGTPTGTPGTPTAPAAPTAPTAPGVPARTPAAPGSVRSRMLLPVVLGGAFMTVMDSFILNVAAPTIRTSLHTGLTQSELVISGYVLAYGLLLITTGRLGDLHGHRRAFLAGLALFTAASLACGLATSATALIALRLLQALGAAILYPQVLALLQTSFTGRHRARAFAAFGATIGAASVTGQLLGGVLLAADPFGLSWRTAFLVNVPAGALLLTAAAFTIPRTPQRRPARLDLTGVLLLTGALLLLTLPLVHATGPARPPWTWTLPLLSLPAFAAFHRHERALHARGGTPLVPPALLRSPAFRRGGATALAFFAGNAGLFFALALLLQNGLGYSPLQAGLTFTPLACAFVAASLLAPRLKPPYQAHVLVIGYTVNAAGTLLLLAATLLPATAGDRWTLMAALAVIGFGEGLGVSPLFAAVLRDAPAHDSAAASGAMETAAQIGMSLGITVTALVFSRTLGTRTGAGAHQDAFTAALAAVTLLALLALALAPRPANGTGTGDTAPRPGTGTAPRAGRSR